MYFTIIFSFIRSRCVIESGRIWSGANAVKRLIPAFWCCLFATQTADSHSFFPRYFIQMLSIIHISRIFGNWCVWVTWLCVDIADLVFWNDFRYRKLLIVIYRFVCIFYDFPLFCSKSKVFGEICHFLLRNVFVHKLL